MSESILEDDCRVGDQVPEAVVGVTYDIDEISEDCILRDENGKVVMYANPETFAKFRNHPKVVEAAKKRLCHPLSEFVVDKDIKAITVLKNGNRTATTEHLKAYYRSLFDSLGERNLMAEQSIRDMVSRNVQRDLDAMRRRAAA